MQNFSEHNRKNEIKSDLPTIRQNQKSTFIPLLEETTTKNDELLNERN